MKARPKTATVLSLKVPNAELWMSCSAQQKWNVTEKKNGWVTLEYKNITLKMWESEYQKNWKEVEK